jgi:hypothetical protein
MRRSKTNCHPRQANALPIIDVLPLIADTPPDINLIVTEAFVTASALFTAFCVKHRPRGSSRDDLLEPRPSLVSGTGLFALKDIAEGTILGSYPGRPRSNAEMLQKVERLGGGSADYAASTGRGGEAGIYLDPTDEKGVLSIYPGPGSPWPWPCNVNLAFINEPPPGKDTNCSLVDGREGDPADLCFVTTRHVTKGSEMFVDYGPTYNRSSYDKN